MVYWKLTINDKKRGHFILKGSVIVNQIIRSPGIYYQEKNYMKHLKMESKPEISYKRYYADLICLRGTCYV
jgi:DNA-directed RNA polymerase beta subunit